VLKRPWVFAAIVVMQTVCAVVFLSDIVLTVIGVPFAPIPWVYREVLELAATGGLVLGAVLGGLLLRSSLRRTREAENALRAASGAFMELVDDHFTEWGLTAAERDVALFALKGMSIAEIAELRQTSQGTVKAQTNAIYRKAGVSGRPQLLSLFVDELMDAPADAPKATA
jgi:DNA-binding CsgD family transcriptional regulator